MKKVIIFAAMVAALIFPYGLSFGADSDGEIYGSRLMTQEERNEYRSRLQTAKTAEERERIRNEHREQIRERAKARGITVPDDRPSTRGNMLRGGGKGRGGMGGGGMGSGRGGGRGR